MSMKLVVLESPFRGKDANEAARNVAYARRALRDCLLRQEAPFASHLLYAQPGVLEDGDAYERTLGMSAGFDWGAHAQLVAVYLDFGLTEGMQLGIERARVRGVPIDPRWLNLVWLKGAGLAAAGPPEDPDARCIWCGRIWAAHYDAVVAGEAVPRVPCGLLKAGFAVADGRQRAKSG